MKEKKKSFYTRGFVSLLMAFSFLGLAISGIVMYIAPPCSVAERIGWTVLALSKDQWASMHQVSALFILVLAIFHLFIYNWKTFMCYVRDRRSKRQADRDKEESGTVTANFRMPKELVAALIVAVVMYAGALTFIAPFGWLHDGSEAIEEYYRKEAPSGTGRGYGTGDRQGEGMGADSREINTEDQKESRGLGTGRRDGSGQGRGRISREVVQDTTG